MLVNMSDEMPQGNYWFTIDCLPEKQSLGCLDVGDSDILDEHKEMNVVRMQNGPDRISNNRLKWIPESLSTKGAIKKNLIGRLLRMQSGTKNG